MLWSLVCSDEKKISGSVSKTKEKYDLDNDATCLFSITQTKVGESLDLASDTWNVVQTRSQFFPIRFSFSKKLKQNFHLNRRMPFLS